MRGVEATQNRITAGWVHDVTFSFGDYPLGDVEGNHLLHLAVGMKGPMITITLLSLPAGVRVGWSLNNRITESRFSGRGSHSNSEKRARSWVPNLVGEKRKSVV
jgi:hypothetical protein